MVKMEVTISDILEYIGNRSRPLKEGDVVFKAWHIILCGLEAANIQRINRLCLQTSNLTSRSHEKTIGFGQNVNEWKCACKSGFCNHITATLIHINSHDDLDLISCTYLEQKWGKEKKGVEETCKHKPFMEYCHPKIKKEYIIKSSLGLAESALAKVIGRSLQPNVDFGC